MRSQHAAVTLQPYAASFATAVTEGCVLSGLGLDDVHTPRGLSHSMPSDDSQLDALEHTVDVAAVQNSLAHMSMPHGGIKNNRRPQATSPGGHTDTIHLHEAQLADSFSDLEVCICNSSSFLVLPVQFAMQDQHAIRTHVVQHCWMFDCLVGLLPRRTVCLARVGKAVFVF